MSIDDLLEQVQTLLATIKQANENTRLAMEEADTWKKCYEELKETVKEHMKISKEAADLMRKSTLIGR